MAVLAFAVTPLASVTSSWKVKTCTPSTPSTYSHFLVPGFVINVITAIAEQLVNV